MHGFTVYLWVNTGIMLKTRIKYLLLAIDGVFQKRTTGVVFT